MLKSCVYINSDKAGCPLRVNAILVYSIVNAKRAALDVPDYETYIRLQATATLKQVVSRYPYESIDSSEPCLKSETKQISRELRRKVQSKIKATGAFCQSFSLQEIAYSKEIASAM